MMKILVKAKGKDFLVLKEHTMKEYGGAEV